MAVGEFLPPPTEYTIALKSEPADAAAEIVDKKLSALDIRWSWNAAERKGVGFAKENVWSRSARRRQKREAAVPDKPDTTMEIDEDSEDENIALGFRVQVKAQSVEIRWLRGQDSVLFESFCGMLKRTIAEAT